MKKVSIFLATVIFSFFTATHATYAFDYHLSYMGNYDVTRGTFGGEDFTVILAKNVGVRYSRINKFEFIEEDTNLTGSNGVYSYKVEGDYKMPMILKMVDYKSFEGGNKGPFDFLTAYFGVGYANLDMKISKKTYSASGGQMVLSNSSENVNTPVYATSVGFYGGEKFVVVDTRLRYLKGEIKDSDIVDHKIKFDDWSIIISLGVGF